MNLNQNLGERSMLLPCVAVVVIFFVGLALWISVEISRGDLEDE